MKVLSLIFVFCLAFSQISIGQTCTLTGSGSIDWDNASPPTCSEGGNAGSASVVIIPAGLTVNFDDNGDTWAGVRIDVFGTLNINAPGSVTINSSIAVRSGGLLSIGSKLSLGSSSGCGYTLGVEAGGSVDITGGTSDRLNICGQEIVRGGTAGCNDDYPNGEPTYCEPPGGFEGPTGFDEDGYDGTLPVTWLSFQVRNIDNRNVYLSWSTATEINTESFSIERSSNGKNYMAIGSRNAAGTSNVKQDYSFTDVNPFIGRTYYRLKQIDLDGTFSYSDIRFIDLTGKKSVSVYPNPVAEGELNVLLNFSGEETVYGSIFDISGLEIQKFSFLGSEFSAPLRFQAGSYFLKVKTGKEELMCRFVVR